MFFSRLQYKKTPHLNLVAAEQVGSEAERDICYIPTAEEETVKRSGAPNFVA